MNLLRLRACGVAVATALLAVVPATAVRANETPSPEAFTATVTPSSPEKGQKVTVVTRGWEPGAQLQAVVCGAAGQGGSSACHLPGAVIALVSPEGGATHTLTAAGPPVPCPCVVRVSTFTGEALAANVPIDLRGHEIAELPEVEEASGDLRVEKVRVKGTSPLRTLLGIGGPAEMTVTLANRGDAPAQAPDLEYGFGRGDVEPDRTHEVDLLVPAGATRDVVIDVDVSLLAFGSQQGVVQFEGGVGGTQSGALNVFPLGALLLLVGGLLAVVCWDLWRTGAGRAMADSLRPGARRFLDEDGAYPLPEIVYLEDIGGYLVKPSVLKNSRVAAKIGGRVTVCDLAKLVDGHGKALLPNGEDAAAPVGTGGMLSHFLRHDRHRDGGRHSGGSMGSGPGLSFFIRRDRDV